MKLLNHNRRFLLFLVMLSAATFGRAQTSFDPKEGCLNVIDVTLAQGLGEYDDKCISANYLHEKFINERFSIGPGIGYSHHNNYNFSAIPVFLSTHYFFLDKRFSPFVNLRIGLKRKTRSQPVYVAKRRREDAHHSEHRHNGINM